MNASLANFLQHEMPALLKREGRRSLKMKPGEFQRQTRVTPFSLFVANCCMNPTLDSKLYDDGTGRTLYLTNTALTAGVEITDERVAAYRAAREGDKKYFASANRTPRNKREIRFSLLVASVFDRRKQRLGWELPKMHEKDIFWLSKCPYNVRKRIGAFPYNEDLTTLMSVSSDGKSTRNGNSQSDNLSGKTKSKAKKKKSALVCDPAAWLQQRNNKYLYETCLGLLILPKGEAGAINPSKFRSRTELIKQLMKFAANPQVFRKNQEGQRQSSADREMGAYGYSDFTSVLHEEMAAQKQWNDEVGLKKPKQEDDYISCDSMLGEEGFAETKKTVGNQKCLSPSLKMRTAARSYRWYLTTSHLLDE
jgi:hypothetical protein